MSKKSSQSECSTYFRHSRKIEKLLNDVACEYNTTKTYILIKALLLYAQIPPNKQEIKERAIRIDSSMDSQEIYTKRTEDNRYRYWYKNAFSSIISIARININAGCGINMLQVKKMVRTELELFNTFPPDIKEELAGQYLAIRSLLVESKIKHYCSHISNDPDQVYRRFK